MGANEKHDAAYHGSERDRAFGADPKPSAASATPERKREQAAPMSPVARWVTGIVALAIITPFVAIIWAMAAGVIRSLGGLW